MLKALCACALAGATALVMAPLASAQSHTVFEGLPVVKISEGGTERLPQTLSREKAVSFGCAISEIDGKYYWASRENKELIRRTSGAFVTYIAIDGSGYIRVIEPNEKSVASLMSPSEATLDYVEHLLIGLQSVTYYGNIR
ncbi:MAG: hypothetical protein EWM73_02911 [Nitrospira sp.]|nr:MAG: hypothetical protein EWM73_02911 [Nitrospira sp.]